MSGQESSVQRTADPTGRFADGYAQGWNRTEVPRPLAILFSVVFCAGLVVVPLIDGLLGSWREPFGQAQAGIARVISPFSKSPATWSAVVEANNASLGAIESFETSLEEASAIAGFLRPSVLDALLRWGGAGSEEAYVGHDGWLFYRPDVDALVFGRTGENPAVEGVADFAAQLAARGIRLVVVPVPGKATIQPEQLAWPTTFFERPPASPAVSGLAAGLSTTVVEDHESGSALTPIIVDTTTHLWSRRNETGEDQFLQTDSHWTPAAMRAVAGLAADAVENAGVAGVPEQFSTEGNTVAAVGDTALMHDLPRASPLLRPQSVEIATVLGADGKEWRADRASPVLVLGDSYTNIYSSEDLGWGKSSGFAEHLSLSLGYRVDKLARNDSGARSAREMLAVEDARHPGWLDGKKFVVWVMAAREFARGDWSHVALAPAQQADRTNFFVAAPGQPVELEVEVKSIGTLPASGATPYADYLTAVHLTGLRDVASGREMEGEALAYVFTMRNRRIEVPPGLNAGSRIKLRLSNYAEKSDKLDSLNRGELDDLDVMMEEPNLAEWPDSQN